MIVGIKKSPPVKSYDVFEYKGGQYGYFIFNRGCGKKTTKEKFDLWKGFKCIMELSDGPYEVTVEPDPRIKNQTEEGSCSE